MQTCSLQAAAYRLGDESARTRAAAEALLKSSYLADRSFAARVQSEEQHRATIDEACARWALHGDWAADLAAPPVLVWCRVRFAQCLANSLLGDGLVCHRGEEDLLKRLLVNWWAGVGVMRWRDELFRPDSYRDGKNGQWGRI